MSLSTFSALITFAIENEKKGLKILNSFAEQERQLVSEFIEESQKILKKLETILRENVTEMVMEPCEELDEKRFEIEKRANEPIQAAVEITEKQKAYLEEVERIINLSEVKRAIKKLIDKKTELIERSRL